MFDENQLVETRWNSKTKKYYEDKGYVYTGMHTPLFVKAKDLKPTSREQVDIICDMCGKHLKVRYNDYYGRNHDIDACCECGKKKSGITRKQNCSITSIAKASEICKEYGCTLITKPNEYVGKDTVIEIFCPKHGVQHQPISSVLGNKTACPECGYERRVSKNTYSCEYVESYINGINGNVLLNPDEYVGSKVKNLKIKCGSCGNVYITDFQTYKHFGLSHRCKECTKKESKPELLIRKFLTSNNIMFEQEKRFDDCRDALPLPFDFYLEDYNLLIEFDGQQHYKPVPNRDYETTVKHDNIKNEYCASHNIDLLRIPYWEVDNIEEILKDKLCL